jgi:hypothetical protein
MSPSGSWLGSFSRYSATNAHSALVGLEGEHRAGVEGTAGDAVGSARIVGDESAPQQRSEGRAADQARGTGEWHLSQSRERHERVLLVVAQPLQPRADEVDDSGRHVRRPEEHVLLAGGVGSAVQFLAGEFFEESRVALREQHDPCAGDDIEAGRAGDVLDDSDGLVVADPAEVDARDAPLRPQVREFEPSLLGTSGGARDPRVQGDQNTPVGVAREVGEPSHVVEAEQVGVLHDQQVGPRLRLLEQLIAAHPHARDRLNAAPACLQSSAQRASGPALAEPCRGSDDRTASGENDRRHPRDLGLPVLAERLGEREQLGPVRHVPVT